ncbi:50S ribosomal protein L3 [Candidatus Uhrbacteria bacterium]|nr:50S ribosomal protein L3 [Candidatus Uhrbacteria bacterium]
MKVLLGKKIAMSQVFGEDGNVIPVTLVEAGPCTVVATRTSPSGAQTAVLGFGTRRNVTKAQKGQFGDLGDFRLVREFPLGEGETVERGTKIDVTAFATGDTVNIVGTAKGRGFQGVVKRHGFAGHPSTHGHKDQLRKSGSIGAGGIQRVFKGLRMAGRMGNNRVTVKNLTVMAVDPERNILAIKGAIPGARGSQVTILATDGNVWQK